jgi:hypothetical protein
MIAPFPKRWTIASIALPMIERTSPPWLESEDLGVERRTAMLLLLRGACLVGGMWFRAVRQIVDAAAASLRDAWSAGWPGGHGTERDRYFAGGTM